MPSTLGHPPPGRDDQLSLDDVGPRHRATDPPTSRQEPTRATVQTRCRRYLVVIREAGDEGRTRDEVSRIVDARGAEDRALSRRLTDLLHAGLIEDSGRTRLSESSRQQVVWVVTTKGRLEVARLVATVAGRAS